MLENCTQRQTLRRSGSGREAPAPQHITAPPRRGMTGDPLMNPPPAGTIPPARTTPPSSKPPPGPMPRPGQHPIPLVPPPRRTPLPAPRPLHQAPGCTGRHQHVTSWSNTVNVKELAAKLATMDHDFDVQVLLDGEAYDIDQVTTAVALDGETPVLSYVLTLADKPATSQLSDGEDDDA